MIDSHVAEVLRSTHPPAEAYKSRASQRQVEHETLLCLDVLTEVLAGGDVEEALRASVWGARRFEKLPKFRRAYVEGYADGVRDWAALAAGLPPSKKVPEPRVRIPRWVQQLQAGAWKRHGNGGGWVAATAFVEATAYIGPDIAVFERGRILGRTQVRGGSRIYGDAELWGAPRIGGGAHIHGTAQVCDRAVVMHVDMDRGRAGGSMQIRSTDDLGVLTAASRRATMVPAAP